MPGAELSLGPGLISGVRCGRTDQLLPDRRRLQRQWREENLAGTRALPVLPLPAFAGSGHRNIAMFSMMRQLQLLKEKEWTPIEDPETDDSIECPGDSVPGILYYHK